MMKDYLERARHNLEGLEEKNKERPPSNEKANINWAIQRIRDMIIKADVKLEEGKDIYRDINKIEEAFNFIAKIK